MDSSSSIVVSVQAIRLALIDSLIRSNISIVRIWEIINESEI